MKDSLYIILIFTGGGGLGVIFFGGLWLTVKKSFTTKRPAIWFLGSLFLRVAITLTGFFLISQRSWQYMIVCLIGFMAARYLIVHITRPNQSHPSQYQKDYQHEH